MAGNRILFLSDTHLGAPTLADSRARERRLCAMLDAELPTVSQLFLLGDIFDYWFEYREVAPRGYLRLLGRLADFADTGNRIVSFKGNHDMWQFGYLADEIGMEILRAPQTFTLQGLKLHMAHGDGLGPRDHGYKVLKKVLANPIAQRLYALAHPNLGIRAARYFSGTSRRAGGHNPEDARFLGEDEWLIQYCRTHLQTEHVDAFLFGHRHYPIVYPLSAVSNYVNLGDWLRYDTYAVLDNGVLELLQWTPNGATPYVVTPHTPVKTASPTECA